MRLTYLTKWFIALPFTALVTIVVPGIAAGDLLWFLRDWMDILFVTLSAGMWLIATAFMDTTRPRGSPDLANLLIPLGLIFTMPIAVWDWTIWIASTMPAAEKSLGILLSVLAVILGIEARMALGWSYSPRASHASDSVLVKNGPYRWIRHPLYSATLLWIMVWPLIIASFLGSIIAAILIVPAIRRRILSEERDLLKIYGNVYADYQKETWHLFPYIY